MSVYLLRSPRSVARKVAAGALTVVGIAASAAVAPAPAVAGPQPAAASGGAPQQLEHHTVALVTGDTVAITRGPKGITSYRVTPGPGREDITFLTRSSGDGAVSVVPSDALTLLATDHLDPQLFDLGALIDNATTDGGDLPLLTQYGKTATAERSDKVRAMLSDTARTTRTLPRLGLNAVRVAPKDTGRMWRAVTGGEKSAHRLRGDLGKLWLDRKMAVSLDRSVPQINAPIAWQAGLTGTGVTVAVLDTGYDVDHPDLKDAVVASADFVGEGTVDDHVGHGTHVSSTIAGSGAASEGSFKGVAPGAKLAEGKVCGVDGCPWSAILAGMQWAATEVHAKVINMSLGSIDTPGVDPLEAAVNDLSAQTGALFVIAAGNDGCSYGAHPIGSPSTADAALSVAAVTDDDYIASFSSCGPRAGDSALKPEISAPGVNITAAVPGGGYGTLSGTSMATPHVAGAAAILAQQHPDWTGQQLKAALTSSAVGISWESTPSTRYGTGRVDLARAIAAQVTPSAGAVNVNQPWPRPTTPVTRTVSYRNDGNAPAVLDLAVSSVPAALVTLNTSRLEVPAGGSASVTLTMGSEGEGEAYHLGALTASVNGTQVARTALTYHQEARYDVSVNLVNRLGEVADGGVAAVNGATGEMTWLSVAGGTARALLPAGRHYLLTTVYPGGPDDVTFTYGIVPITVTDESAILPVTVDARLGKQVRLDVSDRSAEHLMTSVDLALDVAGRRLAHGGAFGLEGANYVLPLDDPAVTYNARAVFDKKGSSAQSPSPYYYRIADVRDGVPTKPVRTVAREELARVVTTFKAPGVASSGFASVGMVSDSGLPTLSFEGPVTYPSTVIEYRSPGQYESDIRIGDDWIFAPTKTVSLDQESKETWNNAILGPMLDNSTGSRREDFMSIPSIPWFIDAEPHTFGFSPASGTLTLSRDGQQVTQWPADQWGYVYGLPTEKSTYSLRASVSRDVPYSTLSNRIDTEWRFTAEGTDSYVDNPLFVPRLTAVGLDGYNQAVKGSRTKVLIGVGGRPSGGTAGTHVKRVEVSYNEGGTWQPLAVTATSEGQLGQVMVENRSAAGHVALRVTLDDRAGNQVTQTVYRAYGVRSR
ncbi:Serine protease, subtilisin family [Micromonospora avicenniae]|uniref:Serine protease, subtilisin family n=1 Tax=Micromonospora avicenniae TaxID=1198245 RepID=A0A1N7F4H0_9ACTN|nr:Serine protease, subtilisin family [Micromonospora avicenniae]